VIRYNPSIFKKGDDHPVEMVSWEDAKEFIRKLGSENKGQYKFRLPTEAEWEYACRSGGKPERYAGGSDVDSVAWLEKNSGSSTHPVGTKAPNGLGIYDMTGNVWEWCEDKYGRDAYGKHQRNNPIYKGGGSYRVLRGGGWGYSLGFVRCAVRGYVPPSSRGGDMGFRLVRIP
jgi:formylglycine-generating enzyme required for sulfatase activity